jgi:hypothetical protein
VNVGRRFIVGDESPKAIEVTTNRLLSLAIPYELRDPSCDSEEKKEDVAC